MLSTIFCLQIKTNIILQDSINRMRQNMYAEEIEESDNKLSLASLEFGSVIAKGSNAVVYEAREKSKAGMQFLMPFKLNFVALNICIYIGM